MMRSTTLRYGYTTQQLLVVGILMYAVLFVAYLAYWPGLWGLFILDDHGNLESLKHIRQESVTDFSRFIFSGISSRLGRPISLATFAPQFYAWPHAPYIFKHVNLMLHLLNGVLVFWLTLKLFELSKSEQSFSLIGALLTSTLWLLHPLQVSTVSYIIQRMTELSALFTFVSVITYLYGRQWAQERRIWLGYFTMSTALGIGLPLAVLCKENGILIPIFIGVIEWTLLATVPRPRHWRFWSLIFLALPIVLLLSYFATHAQSFFIGGYSSRDFNLSERLLTEPRVLMDYLRLFFVPSPSDLGLYFDNYSVSNGLLSPPSTLFAICLLFALVTGAVYLRMRTPVFSFGVLWFLGGHLLESSALPLELYFHHRNYVPLLGPTLTLVYYLYKVFRHIESRYVRLIAAIGALTLVGAYTLITYTESMIWGDSLSQAKIWAQEKPDSKRAQDWYAVSLIMQGKVAEAQQIFRQKTIDYPEDSTPYLQLAEATCYDSSLIFHDVPETLKRLRHAPRVSTASMNLLVMLVKHKEEGKCAALTPSALIEMLDALIANPNYKSARDRLHMLRGRVLSILGKPMQALNEYENSYRALPTVPTLLDMVKIAAQAGRIDLVQALVNRAREDPKLPRLQKAIHRDLIDSYQSQLDRLSGER